jgi:hypothetical protein
MARAVQGHFNIITPWHENGNVINYFNRESTLWKQLEQLSKSSRKT